MSEEEIEQEVEPIGPEGEESYEEQARRWGWHPDGGDLTAEEFVNKAYEEGPLLRAQLKKLDERNRKMEQELEKVAGQMGDMRRRAYDQALEDVKAQQRKAVEEGDVQAHERASRELEKLSKEAQSEPKQEEPKTGFTPDFEQALDAWKAENPWYAKSPGFAVEFNQVHDFILQQEPNLSHEERLKKAEKEIKTKYPDHFRNQRRDKPGAVNTPGGGKGGGNKSFSNLPQELKDQYERLLNWYPESKREDAKKRWAKRYFEGSE